MAVQSKSGSQAGTAEAGGVTDGSPGRWLRLNPPQTENESWSLTYPGGSSSSGAQNGVTGERPPPSWAVTAQISRSCQSSFHSRAYVKTRPASPGLCRASFPSPRRDLSARLSHPALSLTPRPSDHPFVCHPPSISLQSTSLKSPPPRTAPWYLVIRPGYYPYLSIHPLRCSGAEMYPGSHPPRCSPLGVSLMRRAAEPTTPMCSGSTTSSSNRLNRASVSCSPTQSHDMGFLPLVLCLTLSSSLPACRGCGSATSRHSVLV